MKRVAHDHTCFNLKRSDSLPLDRDLNDNRHHKCAAIQYPDNLPTSSVVFVFFNEPLSPLFRSVISVCDPVLLLRLLPCVLAQTTVLLLSSPGELHASQANMGFNMLRRFLTRVWLDI